MSAGALHDRPKPRQAEGLLAGKYRTIQYLGRGTSATVWEAVDEASGEKYAVKVFDKHKGNWSNRQKQAVREAKLLQSLNHPAIVTVCETFDAPFKFHIVMQLVVGASLREVLRQQSSPGLAEDMSRKLFEQICDGLRYCHTRNIAHRDVKLENILLEFATGAAKIIDFGFAVQMKSGGQRSRVFCGTPSYMAPELVMGKEYCGLCTDMWALGVVLYGMLVGQLPFQGQTESQLYAKIRRGSFRFPDGLSELPRRLVSGLLRIDAPGRPTAAQALQHRWVRPQACEEVNDAPKWGRPQSAAACHEARARPSSVPATMRRLRTPHS
jgi:serine/threonine protein kinase